MRAIKFLSFLFLISYIAKAQDKTASKVEKDTIQETKKLTISDSKQVQPAKVIICGPNRASLIQVLYVLDGKIIDKEKISKIKPDAIESMKALQPNEAKLIYGDQGANGAIVIISKKKAD
ncbi:hypothetical protein [Flavobacterium anhuiense]|uniref:TonB-dependent receptor family protein n=1 Tax=Flavobacterium anhuiense TaxID=459526 RepID=A0A444W3Y4_9FLAO|nr:hypothetical protein [Flavobacterium anhuiense]RYJ40607.1 TonB-dependent receptor family protein [Flavobacterium anhuiense]